MNQTAVWTIAPVDINTFQMVKELCRYQNSLRELQSTKSYFLLYRSQNKLHLRKSLLSMTHWHNVGHQIEVDCQWVQESPSQSAELAFGIIDIGKQRPLSY